MRLNKRLERVEALLTPKQAVLLDLKETLELGLLGFAKKALETPRHQETRARIEHSVGKAVRESLSAQRMSPEVIAQAVREAEKQADFLLVLIRDLRKDVAFVCELNAPYAVLLYEKVRAYARTKYPKQRLRAKPVGYVASAPIKKTE